MTRRLAGVLAAALVLVGCGRLGYGRLAPLDAAGGLDASSLVDAPAAASDSSVAVDAAGDAARVDTGSRDAGPDAGPAPPSVPDECQRGPLPTGVALPVVTPMPVAVEGRVVRAGDTDALTRALADALPGDVVELEPGIDYRSAYTIASDDITLRTRGIDAVVPASRRVAPADAPRLARLVSGGGSPTLTIRGSNVHVIGLELATDAVAAPPIVESAPGATGIVLDRLFIHGAVGRDVRAGVALNGPSSFLVRSHVEEIHAMAGPRPAVLLYTCGSSIVIADNHLESAGEAVVMGTEMPLSPAQAPRDVAICANHITRPLRWYPDDASFAGIAWPTAPLVGLYDVERALVAGNVIERAWEVPGGSGARAFAVEPGNIGGAVARVRDVVLVWNHVRDVPEVLSLGAGPAGAAPLERVLVADSLFEPIEAGVFGADTGRIVQILAGAAGAPRGLVIDRVTAPSAVQNGIIAEELLGLELLVRDSILGLGAFGLVAAGREGVDGFPGLVSLVLIGGRPDVYGVSSARVATIDDVGFVDPMARDWALSTSSPFLAASSSGGPVGCEVGVLRAVLAGVAP